MSSVIKAVENKYIIGCLVLLTFLLYLGVRLPEYRRQYWNEDDLLRLSGADIYRYAEGMENLGGGAVKFIDDKSEIRWEDDNLSGTRSVRFYITELSVAGIRTLITADGSSGEIFLTKGENTYTFAEPIQKGCITVSIMDARDVRLNWDRVAFEKQEDQYVFPATLAIILMTCLCLMLYTGNTGNRDFRVHCCRFFIVILLFYQVRNIFYYFDDYGYLSLSYQNLYHVQGNINLTDILSFLNRHYLKWGGRVLYFFFLILYGRNIWIIRFALCLHIFMIVYIGEKLIGYEKPQAPCILTAAMTFLLYGLIEVEFMRDGVYWFTASAIYVFPVVWVLLGVIWIYQESFQDRKTVIGKRSKTVRILCLPILFLATCSQEQISLTMTAMVLIATVEYVIKRKRIEPFHVLANIVSWIGSAILLCAPGNYERLNGTEVKKSVIECAVSALHIVTSDSTKYITIAFMIAVCMVATTTARKTSYRVIRVLCVSWILLSAVIGMIMFAGGYGMLTAIQTIFRIIRLERLNEYGNMIMAIYLVGSWILLIAWYTVFHRLRIFRWILVGTAVICGTAIFSPDVSRRMFVPFYLLLIMVIGEIMITFATDMQGAKQRVFAVILATLTACAGLNYHYILYGYYRNAESAEYNMEILQNFDKYADDNHYVLLEKNQNDTFANMMPYMSDYEYIMDYIKEMYRIPDDAIIRWKGSSDIAGRKETGQ